MIASPQFRQFQPFRLCKKSPGMNRMDNDDRFLSLLSSQRSLLVQIQQEANERQQESESHQQTHQPQQAPYSYSHVGLPQNPAMFSGHSISSMNTNPTLPQHANYSMQYYHPNMQMYHPSVRHHPSDPHYLHPYSYPYQASTLTNESSLEPTPIRMRHISQQHRRNSTSSSMGGNFFTEMNRLEKLTPTNLQTYDSVDELTRIRASSPLEDMDYPHSLDDVFKDSKAQLKSEDEKPRQELVVPRRKSSSKEKDATSNIVPYSAEDVKRFAEALDKSTNSQQEIHNWDRKMGLKRSHSKTMTMSMQSRKKLKFLVKRITEDQNRTSNK